MKIKILFQVSSMALAVVAASNALGGGEPLHGDLPDALHAWGVHDRNRPIPLKVTPADILGQPPSDAVVLFDGSLKSFEENWSDKNGGKTKWKFVNGTMESVSGAGYICSRQEFGDVQLHVEWQAPVEVRGFGQGRGNSGVFFLGGMYEVQVLDSFETNPADMKNPNYSDGLAGSIYGQNPPLVNPTRRPGEWQVYDIVFHQPVFDGDKCVHPGTVTVFLNGVLVQDHWELEGPTMFKRRTSQIKPKTNRGSIQFQDHGNPVHFRNVWVRELPSRYANTVHGTYLANKEDVAAKRSETAAGLFAGLNVAKDDASTLASLLEVVGYSDDERYVSALKDVATRYRVRLEAMDDAALSKERGGLISVCEKSSLFKNAAKSVSDAIPFAALNALRKRCEAHR